MTGWYHISNQITEKISSDRVWTLIVAGDKIYYAKRDYDNQDENQRLYSISLDGNNRIKLSSEPVGYINIIGDWIYYSSLRRVYRIRIDGKLNALPVNISFW